MLNHKVTISWGFFLTLWFSEVVNAHSKLSVTYKIFLFSTLKSFFKKKFDLFFPLCFFFECMIAEIHNSYAFNTFNEYQREVFPIENTVVCITRSMYVLHSSSISRCYKSQFTYLMFLFSPFHNTRILFPLFFQWILISLCRSNNKGKCNCVSFFFTSCTTRYIFHTGQIFWKKIAIKSLGRLPGSIVL